MTFVVPCYNLAHYLEECVDSIFSQSYSNIEVLILNDQSPDDTIPVGAALCRKYADRNIKLVNNESNLGNLENYNKGIRLAAGEYVWILSPDDKLRDEDAVQKHIRQYESNKDVGFIFSSVHRLKDETDIGLYASSQYNLTDSLIDGETLVGALLGDRLDMVAPSVSVRKCCYEAINYFPKDLPHRGDTYVWALIAMSSKVGFIAEPLVDYRIHSDSMCAKLSRENIGGIVKDNVGVRWRIRSYASDQSRALIASQCLISLGALYQTLLSGRFSCRGTLYRMSVDEFEKSVASWEQDESIRKYLTACVCRELLALGALDIVMGRFARGGSSVSTALILLRSVQHANRNLKVKGDGFREHHIQARLKAFEKTLRRADQNAPKTHGEFLRSLFFATIHGVSPWAVLMASRRSRQAG